ncbi:DUF305 domain-containing protein [Nonomuraea sp. NPDC050663]|uniref:DUF305 domain-containing protein n=1 Tax=Nonomuraea sp. NPDC050663 TaxID=3364370 RepID=UPI00379F4F30
MSAVRLAGIVLVLALTGACAAAASPPVPSGAGYNPADLAFSQQMIPHHLQTIQLAELAVERSGDGGVRGLATDLIKKEKADIALMSGWLRGWGAAVPSKAPDGGHTMPGMLSPVQFDVLERRDGSGFDRLWKSVLAAHLGSGIRMAETVRAGGQHPPTAAFVETLIAEQTDLIGELGGPA